MNGKDGTVVALYLCRVEHASPEPRDVVRATERGLEGDRHAGRSKRQVLVMDLADLRELGLRPGELREQVTVDLPGLMALPTGSRVRLGSAVLEITGPCEPCTHIGTDIGVGDVEAFRDSLRGRRGMLARVVEPGEIRVGSGVSVVHETAPA